MAESQRRGRCVGRVGGHRSPRLPPSRSRTGRAGPGPRHRHDQRVVARRGGVLGSTRPAAVGARPARTRATGDARARSTTRASSRSSPAPCARSRPPSSAAGSMPSVRTKFQVVALLVREERARRQGRRGRSPRPTAPSSSSGSTASPPSWPRPPPATPRCCRCSPRTPSSPTRPRALKREMLESARRRGCPRRRQPPSRSPTTGQPDRAPRRAPVGRSPASSPTRSSPPTSPRRADAGPAARRLAGWELLGPLFRSFEYGERRLRRAWRCPSRPRCEAPGGLELMRHQAQVVAAAADGPPHLPARRRARSRQDRPGAARRAGRQRLPAARRGPQRRQDQLGPRGRALDARPTRPPSIHGDGDTIDGFADIVVVNYEVLDRHVGWLGDFGFRGMVVDEAHFIKNKSSQRSQHVLQLSERIRARHRATRC